MSQITGKISFIGPLQETWSFGVIGTALTQKAGVFRSYKHQKWTHWQRFGLRNISYQGQTCPRCLREQVKISFIGGLQGTWSFRVFGTALVQQLGVFRSFRHQKWAPWQGFGPRNIFYQVPTCSMCLRQQVKIRFIGGLQGTWSFGVFGTALVQKAGVFRSFRHQKWAPLQGFGLRNISCQVPTCSRCRK